MTHPLQNPAIRAAITRGTDTSRTLTAKLLGDPEPGRSALEKMSEGNRRRLGLSK